MRPIKMYFHFIEFCIEETVMLHEFVITFDYLNIGIKIAGQDHNQDCSTFSPVIVDNCGNNTIVKLIIKCTIVFRIASRV